MSMMCCRRRIPCSGGSDRNLIGTVRFFPGPVASLSCSRWRISNGVRSHSQSAVDEQTLEQIAAVATSRAVETHAHSAALTHCMEKLPSEHRQLVESRYCDATPVNQIASQAGRSADAVSMTLYRIRKALMECIQKQVAREGQL